MAMYTTVGTEVKNDFPWIFSLLHYFYFYNPFYVQYLKSVSLRNSTFWSALVSKWEEAPVGE